MTGTGFGAIGFLGSKRLTRWITSILVAVFILEPVAATGLLIFPPEIAQAATIPDDRPKESPLAEHIEVVREEDGTKSAIVNSRRVFFKDELGEWRRIDSKLVEQTPGTLENRSGSMKARFTKNAADGTTNDITVEKGGVSVRLGLPERAEAPAKDQDKLAFNGDRAVYHYQVLSDAVKESIILSAAPEDSSFSFPIKLTGLTASKQPGGSILLTNSSSGKEEFRISAPYMYDSSTDLLTGEPRYSSKVEYLFEERSGRPVITVSADAEWLNDPETVYPVIIDPTVEELPTASRDMFWTDDNVNHNASNNPVEGYAGYMKEGAYGSTPYKYRPYLGFNMDNIIRLSETINSASLSVNSYYGLNNSNIEMRELNVDGWRWGEDPAAKTWSNQDWYYSGNTDTQAVSTGWVTFDATAAVQDWRTKGRENGFVLKAVNELNTDSWYYHKIYSRQHGVASLRPYLKVNYGEPDYFGTEPYWSFEDEDLGAGHSANINVSNGNLAVQRGDLSVDDRGLSLGFGRTYNSRNQVEDSLAPMGNGWRASLPRLYEEISGGRVRLIDADGTYHYFAKAVDGSGEYISPPGINQIELTKNGSSGWRIENPDYTTQTFDATGKLTAESDRYQTGGGVAQNVVSYVYDASGRLSEIRSPSNPSNRKLSFTYVNGKLDQIAETGISGRVVRFTYTNGRLTGASNPSDSGSYVYTDYGYDGSGYLNSVESPGEDAAWTFTHTSGKVSSWRDPRYEGTGTQTTLSYSADSKVATVTDPAGRTTTYTLGARGLVTQIKDHQNGVTNYTHDFNFNVLKEEDKDASGSIVAKSAATFNANGDVATETDTISTSEAATSSYSYADSDAPHDPSLSTSPLNNVATADYTSEGDLGLATDSQEVNETNTYDDYGNVTKTKSWATIIDSFTLNHSFEKWDPSGAVSAEAWSKYGSGGYDRAYLGSGVAAKGDAVARVVGDGSSTQRGLWTLVGGVEAKQNQEYTMSAWVNIPSYTSGTYRTLRAVVYYTDTPTSNPTTHDGPVLKSTTNGWHRFSTKFTTSSTRDVDHINLYSYAESSDQWNGTAYIDGFQLDKTPLLTEYNMISNGGFDRDEGVGGGAGDGIPDGWRTETTGTGSFTYSGTAFTGVKSSKLSAGSSGTGFLVAGYSVNRLSDNQSSVETDLTGLASQNGATISKSSERTWHGAASLKAVTTTAEPSLKGFYTSTSASVAASKTHTASAYVTGGGVVKIGIIERNSSDGYIDMTWSDPVTLDSSWKRLEVSRAFGASGVKGRLIVANHGAQNATWYADGMQIEEDGPTPGATAWVRPTLTNQIVHLKPSTDYTLTATVKTEGTGLGASDVDIVRLLPRYGSSVSLKAKGTFGWKTISTTFTTTSNSANRVGWIQLRATPANSQVYFDGIKLEEARRETTATFDPATNYRTKSTEIDELQKTTSYQYDERGNVTKTIYHDGTSTAQSFNARDLVTSDTDTLGNTKYYSYDDIGNRTASVSARGFTTAYNYIDGTSMLGSVTDPLSRTIGMTYDSLGNRTLITKPSGATVGTSYDTLNRVTTVSYSSTPVYGYTYDSLSRKTAAKDGSGATLESFGYDMASQMTADTDNNIPTSSYSATFGYDKEGKQTSAVYSGATTTYGYDSAGKVTTMSRTGQPSITLDFNEKGAPVRASRSGALDSFMAYDLRGQVTDLNHVKASGSILQENRYVYDSDGNITSHWTSGAGTTAYDYDAGDRLKYWKNPATGKEYSYSYNADDDLTSVAVSDDGSAYATVQSFAHDAANQVTTYEDSRSGSTQSYSFAYDTDGNLTSDGAAAYSWDDGGRLTRYQNAGSGVTVDYTYASDGLRTSKTVNGAKIVYHWIGTQMVAERDATGSTIATYAYLPGDFAPVSMTRDGQAYFYVKNARGDVTHLTSSTGDVVAKYTYDPWGSPLAITDGAGSDVSSDASHIANKNPWRYAGYYWDQESGMYYLQARYYRPDLYRFISVDPNPDENLYAYSGSNPIVFADPKGTAYVFPKTYGWALGKLKEMRKAAWAARERYSGALSRIDYWFYKQVCTGCKYDFKAKYLTKHVMWGNRAITMEQFGNLAYGYMGRAVGKSLSKLFIGSGYAAWRADTLADEPNDYPWIKGGYKLYQTLAKRYGWKYR